MLGRSVGRALFLAVLIPSSVHAQQADSGTVLLTVQEPMGPTEGALIRSEGRSAKTDGAGRARLVLPAGNRVLSVSRIGYHPKKVTVAVPAGGELSFTINLVMEDMQAMQMEPITVSATRTEGLAGDTPLRVEVLDEMEVDENTLMAPSGITMLLNETPGVRVHSASPSVGTGSVRILGLPGQYTAMLADGLPQYGGALSALGPLDISPVDLQQVEIIKGASSALYGGQALGGVVNLVSKKPSGKKEVLLNKRTLGVTDAAAWLSHRLSPEAGVSLLLSGTIQSAEDRDKDGWGDQPRARRGGARARFARDDAAGRSVFVTAGFGYDDRVGGTLGNATAPDGRPFSEGLTSQRADIGMRARFPGAESTHVAVRLGLSSNGRDRTFGPGPVEHDRISTAFAEVTRSVTRPRWSTVLGASAQGDKYANALNGVFAHQWVTPSLFATGEPRLGPFTLSVSLRGDLHPEGGVQVTERVSVLAKRGTGWSARASVGTGFAPPSALTEETEGIGLRAVRQSVGLEPERSWGTSLDLNGTIGKVELLLTGYGSFVERAIQLIEASVFTRDGVLRNAAGTTRVGGFEAAGIWRFNGGKFLATYGFARGSRTDAGTGQREDVPLLPRHRIGGDLMLERPGVYRVGLEGIWYGAQSLDDDPYRTRSKPYLYAMFLAMRQFGSLEVVANFENLLNVRQTANDPLIRPVPTVGGRWTTDVWAPLEGFMFNVALRYRW